MQLLKDLKQQIRRRGEPQLASVVVDERGFTCGSTRTEWAEVRSIVAFKRAMLTWDEVWFRVETPSATVSVCEEQPGFAQFDAAISAMFPSTSAWREHVIKPAFAENLTVLYRRP